MIQNDGFETFEVHCDDCSNSESFSAGHWDALIREMKLSGWKNLKREGEWEHLCPECASLLES